jgi:hypothetical protein
VFKMKRFYKMIAGRAIALLLSMMLWTSHAIATDYIDDLVLVGGTKDETKELIASYQKEGWTLIDLDLNKGAGGDYIYLLYKKASSEGVNRGYITGFYIKNTTWPYPDDMTFGGANYHLTRYKGGDHFRGQRGDLNSNTGESTDPIHLYYTRDLFSDNKAVSDITFNSTKDGALGAAGSSVGYDLNAGTKGSAIYMHVSYATAVPDLVGEGTLEKPYCIFSEEDWHVFAVDVKNGLKSDKIFGLGSDLSVSEMVGTQDHPFKGEFYGLGHELKLDIVSSENLAAPFHYVDGAIINGVKTSGTVKCTSLENGHPSGLVGSCSGDSVTIENCVVNATVGAINYAGGIVGHAGSGKVTLIGCTFNGVVGAYNKFGAGLVGWCDNATLTLRSCMSAGKGAGILSAKYHPIAFKWADGKATAITEDVFYLKNLKSDVPEANLVAGLEAQPVNSKEVKGEWDDPFTASDGTTYFAAHLASPKAMPYRFRFENSLCDWKTVDLQTGSGLSKDDYHEGKSSFKFEASNHAQYLITPELNCRTKQKVTFHLLGTGDKKIKFQFGVSTTTSDPASFNWSNTYEGLVKNWSHVNVETSGNIKFMAIKYIEDGSPLYIDYFTVEEFGAYIPEETAASDVTEDGAMLKWNGNAETYTVRYRPQAYFFETFDVGKPQWGVHNEGGNDKTNWALRNFYSFTGQILHGHNGGDIVALGRSYDYSGQTAYKVDNWLITPQVDLGGILSYWLIDDGTKHEHYEIWVSTTECVPSAFTKVCEPGYGTQPYQWQEIKVDLTQFQGKKGYIAFRLTDEGKNFLALDDVALYASDWVTVTTNQPSVTLTDLNPSTTYEYQVQGTKDGMISDWSAVSTFTTPQSQEVIDAIEMVQTTSSTKENEGWFDLNGRRLSAKPVQSGIYIKDGRKILRK